MSPASLARRKAGREALEDLKRYRGVLTVERFLADRDEQRRVLHAMLIAVQACIDEALSECRFLNLNVQSYREAFEALGRAGRIPEDLLPSLMGWAGMRNVIAHFYPVLNLRRTFESLGEVDALEQFLDLTEPPATKR